MDAALFAVDSKSINAIATIVNLYKSEFPDAIENLNPGGSRIPFVINFYFSHLCHHVKLQIIFPNKTPVIEKNCISHPINQILKRIEEYFKIEPNAEDELTVQFSCYTQKKQLWDVYNYDCDYQVWVFNRFSLENKIVAEKLERVAAKVFYLFKGGS